MDINSILFLVSLIVFIGYLAEWVFRKINVPDTLLLILVGFVIGPTCANLIRPEALGTMAPLFTTFTLLFLMFDGALYIELRSLYEGFGAGVSLAVANFLVSALVIAGIFYFIIKDPILALMLGFALGGISSAFVIPILKQITIGKKLYSILTLESALTDVLAIVFAITMIELKVLNVFDIKNVLSQIASLFFVAGVLGVIAGAVWIFLEAKVLERDSNYMMTIAYVVLLYFICEYLGGNGAIGAMTFGIVIANSKIMVDMARRVTQRKDKKETAAEKKDKPTVVVSRRERLFYQEISFLLKTFFFVYIGLLLNVSNFRAMAYGTGIAVAIMLLRNISALLTKAFGAMDRLLVNSLFARGIAPAAIILIAVERKLIEDQMVIDTVYFIITATIIFSSIRIFLYRRKLRNEEKNTANDAAENTKENTKESTKENSAVKATEGDAEEREQDEE